MPERILFSSTLGTYTVAPDGSGLTELLAGAGGFASAAPDGSVFVDSNLVLRASDGTVLHPITNADPHFLNLDANPPTFSPDGTKLVGTYGPAGGSGPPTGICIVNADNSGYVDIPIATIGHGTVYWSPDGTKFAFQDTSGPQGGVSICNVDGSGVATVLEGSGTGLSSGIAYQVFGWYSDSTFMLIDKTTLNGHGDPIDVLKANAGSSTTLYTDPTEAHFGGFAQALSPDETAIVLFDDASTNPNNLSILEIASGTLTTLLTPGVGAIDVFFVQWLPSVVPPGAMVAGAHSTGIIKRGG